MFLQLKCYGAPTSFCRNPTVFLLAIACNSTVLIALSRRSHSVHKIVQRNGKIAINVVASQ